MCPMNEHSNNITVGETETFSKCQSRFLFHSIKADVHQSKFDAPV